MSHDISIPVIINNRDLLSWPRAMVEKIKTYKGVGEIIIVDNGSTYPPLLEWYKTNPCKIIYTENRGHMAPWVYIPCIVSLLDAEYYVVTDPDLDLSNTPDDTLLFLKDKLDNQSQQTHPGKIGLGLDWECVGKKSPFYDYLNVTYEKPRWEASKIVDDVYVGVKVDTTFAMYEGARQKAFIGGGSVSHPYVARHLPWEFSKEEARNNTEFSYYMENASNSSSFKKRGYWET